MRSGSVGALPRPGQTWAGWRRAAGVLWSVLQHDRFAFAGIVIYALFVLIALSAPLLTPYDPQQTTLRRGAPSGPTRPIRAYRQLVGRFSGVFMMTGLVDVRRRCDLLHVLCT